MAQFKRLSSQCNGFSVLSTLRTITALILLVALPLSAGADAYVSNKACFSCHQKQFKEWKSSHHYHSMLPATKQHVLGNFNDSTFHRGKQTIKFTTKNGQYFISIGNSHGKTKRYSVQYTFGYEPLQQYLIAIPKGKLQAFTVAWDVQRKRWFDLQIPATARGNSPNHWSKRFYNWNHSCADCHSTNFQKKFDGKRYKSTFSGVNVNCQACHGPGEQHLEWAAGKKAKLAKNSGFPVNFKPMTTRQLTESCGQCHSRRVQISSEPNHHHAFMDRYIPANLRHDLYYPDGQIKEEVFVYGSFLQSKMYQAGVKCTACHNPHSLKLTRSGNAVCTQCHSKTTNRDYPELIKKNYDTETHTHHKKESVGSQCVACHMPETTYMKIDPRRDHAFKIPNPELTVKYNIPNACNRCHTNESATWSLQSIKKWYGNTHREPLLLLDNQKHLIGLAKDPLHPAIFRATAMSLIRPTDEQSMSVIDNGLKDVDPMVRLSSLNALNSLPPSPRMQRIKPLLNDKIRTIRATAASLLLDAKPKQFSPAEKKSFEEALEKYLQMQQTNADQPDAQLNLAQVNLMKGNIQKGIDALKQSVETDKHFIPAYLMLSEVFYTQHNNKMAKSWLKRGIKENPDDAYLYYYLGLLNASELNYDAALVNLRKANRILPRNKDIIKNIIQIYARQNNESQALLYLKALLAIEPNNKQALRLYQQLLNKIDRPR